MVAAAVLLASLWVATPRADAFGIASFAVTPSTMQAGAHPDVDIYIERAGKPSEDIKDIYLDLPAGMMANPEAVPVKCSETAFKSDTCPAASEVGSVEVKFTGGGARVSTVGNLYVLQPGPIDYATIGFIVRPEGSRKIFFRDAIRQIFPLAGDGDYGIKNAILDIPSTIAPLDSSRLTKITIDSIALKLYSRAGSDRAGGYFMLNPTRCDNTAPSRLRLIDYVGAIAEQVVSFTPTGCLAAPGPVPFTVTTDLAMSPTTAANPSAPSFRLSMPSADAALQNSNLRSAAVTFPIGTGLNFTDISAIPDVCPLTALQADQCPAGSRIGSVSADVPILPPVFGGELYLIQRGTQIRFGFMLRGARGIKTPIEGNASTIDSDGDGADDSVVARFINLPEIPYASVTLTFERPVLINPVECNPVVTSKFTGYSGAVLTSTASYALTECGGPLLTVNTPTEGQPLSSGTVSVSFTAGLDATSVSCKLDSGTIDVACMSPTTYTGLAEGPHAVTVSAFNAGGAVTTIIRNFKVDLTPPTLTIDSPAEGAALTTSTVSVAFTAGADAASVTCALDSGEAVGCTSPREFSGVLDGSHSATVVATDRAGNRTTMVRNFTVSGPPIVTISSPSEGAIVTTADVAVTFSVIDATSVACQLDGGAIDGGCVSPKTYSASANGTHTFAITARDAAGLQTTVSRSFIVRVGLYVAIDSPTELQAIPSSTVSVKFTTQDAVSTTCKLDNAKAVACGSPFTFTGVADGAHSVTVSVTDSAGAVLSASRRFSVDTVYPTLSVTAPADGALLTTNAVSVQFTASSDAQVITCRLDSAAIDYACTSPKLYDPVGSGSHHVTVVASDAAGNSTTVVRSFSVDVTGPTLFVTAPAEGAVLSSSNVAVTFSAGADAVSVSCQIDTGVADTSCVSPKTFTGVVDGSHTVTVVAADSAGNKTALTRGFDVDTTPPTLTISAPADTSVVAGGTVVVQFVTGADAVSKTCQLDQGTVDGACISPKTYSGVADGSHSVLVTASDAVGNTATAISGFTVDSTPPTLTVDAPTEGQVLTSRNVDVKFTVGADAVSRSCRLDDGAIDTACVSPKSYTEVANGSHTVTVIAKDQAGNANTVVRNFSVNAAIATITLTVSSPAEGSVLNTTSVSVAFSATGGASALSYTCQLDAGAIDGACVSPKAYAAVTDGAHKATVTAQDTAGNKATVIRNFSVDTTPPALSVTSPASGAVLASGTVDVSFTVGADAVSVSCQLDAGAVASGCASPKTYTAVADGSHSVTVKAADNLGNTATVTRSFSVDTVPPTVSITAPTESQTLTSSTVSVTFAVSADAKTVSCRLDAGTLDAACVSPKSYTSVANGTHSVTVNVSDAAGNTASVVRNFTVSVSTGSLSVAMAIASTSFASAAHPDVTVTLNVSGSADLKVIDISLPPGLWGSAAAVSPRCTVANAASGSCAAATKIGDATATGTALGLTQDATGSAFLTDPPASTDVAGIALKLTNGTLGTVNVQGAARVLNNGRNMQIVFPNVPDQIGSTSVKISKIVLKLLGATGTAAGHPLMTNPSPCATGNWVGNFSGYDGSTSPTASVAYTTTGCATVPFAPTVNTAVTNRVADQQTGVVATVDVPLNHSSINQALVKMPQSLIPNLAAFGDVSDMCPSVNSTPSTFDPAMCPAQAAVGSVSITTPLLPVVATGVAYLISKNPLPWIGVSVTAPGVAVKLIGLTATPQVDPACDPNVTECARQIAITLKDLPDLPVSKVIVDVDKGDRAPLSSGAAAGKVFLVDLPGICLPTDQSKSTITPHSGTAPISATQSQSFSGC